MNRSIHIILVLGAALWCASIVAAPIFHVAAIYSFFSIICHQQAARSWHVQGEPFAVCIRCSSIYFGFLSGMLALRSPNVLLLRLAVAATVAEIIVALLVVDSVALRALSGILLGASAAPFVRIGIEQMFMREARDPV